MSWVVRGKRRRRYFYRSRRDGDKVRKVYVGRGERAEQAAHEIEQRQQDRQAQRVSWAEELAQLTIADSLLHDLRAWTLIMVRATLLVNGFHEHRHQWRKRR